MLELKNISKSFSGVQVVDGFSAELRGNEILGVVGPNGAGKTTLINLISGMQTVNSGSIFYKGEKIDNLRTHEIVRRGIARTFQIPKPFKKLTVVENLMVPSIAVSGKTDRNKIDEILTTLKLSTVASQRAGNISGGQQKLLEIGRILALDPEVLLLDEPTAGVHPDLRQMIVQILGGIKGKSILVVSHDLNFVRQLCQRIVVMNAGKKLCEGDLSVLENPLVVEAYLGRS